MGNTRIKRWRRTRRKRSRRKKWRRRKRGKQGIDNMYLLCIVNIASSSPD